MTQNTKLIETDNNKKVGSEHQCPIYKKTFPYHCILKTHILIHTQEKPYFCKLCPGEFSSTNRLRNHVGRHDSDRERRFQCTLCPKKFFTTTAQKVHIGTHGGEKPFTCDICNVSLTKKASLKQHLLTVHQKRKREFQCCLCIKQFYSKDDLKKHIPTHLGERPIKCGICEKRFTESGYHHHKNVHKGEKNFSCSSCKKPFRTRSHLKRHVMTKHDPNRSKDFQCTLCSKCFYTEDELKGHIGSHTGEIFFKCGICGFGKLYRLQRMVKTALDRNILPKKQADSEVQFRRWYI